MQEIRYVSFDETEKELLESGKPVMLNSQVGYLKDQNGQIVKVRFDNSNNEPNLARGFRLPKIGDDRPSINEKECEALWNDLFNGDNKGIWVYLAWRKEGNKPLINGVRRNPTIQQDGLENYQLLARRVRLHLVPRCDDWREHKYDERYFAQEVLEDSAETTTPSYTIMEEVKVID